MSEIIRNMELYKDMLDMPTPKSKTRAHMAMIDRAAQFSPFAALTGHEEAIEETARLTDKKRELSDYEKAVLDDKLEIMRGYIGKDEKFRIIYFLEDALKEGGEYKVVESSIKDIDIVKKEIVLSSYKKINILDIMNIDSKCFTNNMEK